MDWLTFISEITKALAWPSVATTIALVFRGELRSLVGRVKKGKVGPAEFEFEEEIRELKLEIPRELPALPMPSPQIASQQRAISEPRAVILDAWLQVEQAMNTLAQKHSLYNALAGPGANYAANNLAKLGVLEPWALNLYRDLRRLRNQATHDEGFSPSLESVLGYVQTSTELRAELERATNAA